MRESIIITALCREYKSGKCYTFTFESATHDVIKALEDKYGMINGKDKRGEYMQHHIWFDPHNLIQF